MSIKINSDEELREVYRVLHRRDMLEQARKTKLWATIWGMVIGVIVLGLCTWWIAGVVKP